MSGGYLVPAGARPSTRTALGNHEDRIRALERNLSARGLPFATIRNFSGSLTVPGDNALHYFDLDAGSAALAVFDTSDDEIFQNGVTSAVTGSPLHGIEILAPGSYIEIFDGFFHAGTVGAIAEIYHNDIVTGFGFLSHLQFGRTALALGDGWDRNGDDHVSFFEFQGFPEESDVPCVIIANARLASGVDATADVNVVVVQLNPYGSDAF